MRGITTGSTALAAAKLHGSVCLSAGRQAVIQTVETVEKVNVI